MTRKNNSHNHHDASEQMVESALVTDHCRECGVPMTGGDPHQEICHPCLIAEEKRQAEELETMICHVMTESHTCNCRVCRHVREEDGLCDCPLCEVANDVYLAAEDAYEEDPNE